MSSHINLLFGGEGSDHDESIGEELDALHAEIDAIHSDLSSTAERHEVIVVEMVLQVTSMHQVDSVLNSLCRVQPCCLPLPLMRRSTFC